MANFQLQDVQSVAYTLVAVDKDGNPAGALAAGATLTVSSSATASATVVPDATPVAGSVGSGKIVGGATLGTVQISAVVTNADNSAGPTGAVSIDIVSGPASTISFSLGTPA